MVPKKQTKRLICDSDKGGRGQKIRKFCGLQVIYGSPPDETLPEQNMILLFMGNIPLQMRISHLPRSQSVSLSKGKSEEDLSSSFHVEISPTDLERSHSSLLLASLNVSRGGGGDGHGGSYLGLHTSVGLAHSVLQGDRYPEKCLM